jgi:hypothetical protein
MGTLFITNRMSIDWTFHILQQKLFDSQNHRKGFMDYLPMVALRLTKRVLYVDYFH